MTIAFEKAARAEIWLAETNSPFPLWLDADRTVYRAFGLERSLLRSWGMKNMLYYARAALNGRQLSRRGQDTNQLGGNFIIDRHGVIRLAYRSRNPTDRPAINLLLDVLSQIEGRRCLGG